MRILKTLYEYLRFFQFKISPATTLRAIHIQFTNSCNLRCQWCSFVNTENKQFISKQLLEKLFKEISGHQFRVKEINLWNGGEALLHPRFIEIMELIAQFKKDRNFPKVNLLTNTMLLTKDISKKLIELNAIDSIGFSLDGGSREKSEEIRIGTKFDIIKRNIEDFAKLNNKGIKMMVNCIVPFDKELSSEWMSGEFKEILEIVDFYKLNYLVNNGGEMFIKYPEGFKFNKTNKRICLALLQGLVLIQNGDVLFCCNDFNGKYVLGNLNNKSLFEICNSPARKKLVEEYYKGGKSQIPLCSTCNRFEIPFKVWKN